MKATNLGQVLQFFSPRTPLRGQNLEFWFVERPDTPRGVLRVALRNAQENHQPIKLLLVGHRGSGKSTEINKLLSELNEKYIPITVDIAVVTGRTVLSYVDLMLAMATNITRYTINNGLIGQQPGDALKEGWRKFSEWWRNRVAGLELGAPGEISTYAALSTWLGEIEVGAQRSAFSREQLNAQIDRRMNELVDYLNWILDEAHAYLNPKQLLLVIEGLDKVDLQSAQEIFRKHAHTFTSLKTAMLVTIPLALRYSDEYQDVRRHFDDDKFLHNLAVHKMDGSDDEERLNALRSVALRRMNDSLIEEKALDRLVRACGGITVDLIRLINGAALYAQARSEKARQITVVDAENAIKDLRRELAANLSREDWKLLAQRHLDHEPSNESEMQRLFFKGALIEYSNGVQWCDIHPLLEDQIERYTND